MRDVQCAVCGKPIGEREPRFVDRRRVPLLSRLLGREAQRDEIHTHSDCTRPRGQRPPVN